MLQFENMKARILMSIITWSVMGQQTTQLKKVFCLFTVNFLIYITE